MSSWSRATPALSAFIVCLLVVTVTFTIFVLATVGAPVAGSLADASEGQQVVSTTEQSGSTAEIFSIGSSSFAEIPADENRTTFHVQLDSTGDARWEITETFNLTTDTDESRFEDLGQQFENGEVSQLGLPEFEQAVEEANTGTSRDMRLSNAHRTWDVRGEDVNRTGELTLSFTWESFGNVANDRLVIDEAVLTTQRGDPWLPGLTGDQQLTIRPPEGYGVDDATIAPTGGNLIWTGPVDFNESTLQATFLGNGMNDGNGDDDPGDGEEGLALLPWLFVGVILVVALAVILVGYRRDTLAFLDDHLDRDGGGQAETKTEGKRVEVEDATETAATDPANASAETENEIDVELLSDEERVERLLENNGGRMKQADIVKETDWSNAKVSQLLSAMDEDGRIHKLRIGRENLISFPDENVAEFDSDE